MNVLIVDDELEALELYSDVFYNYGIETVLFDNALDALNYLRKNQVNAIVSDIVMPECDGFEFFNRLKKGGLLADVFVFMTGAWKEEFQPKMQEGIHMIFHKPFSPEGLALYLVNQKKTDKAL